MSHFKRGKTGRWDLSARHSSCMSLCKRVDWCPYCSSWSAGTGKSETYRASELSRTMTGHASVARQCLLPEETQARRVELEMPVMVLVRVPASPLQLLVAFVTYHSPPKRQNPPVTVVSLVLTLAAHRLSLSRSAPAFFTISTRDPRWPEQAGSLRSSLVTPFLVLPPVAGRRVLVLLALSQLPSASPPPPVSGTGTATVLHSFTCHFNQPSRRWLWPSYKILRFSFSPDILWVCCIWPWLHVPFWNSLTFLCVARSCFFSPHT